MRYKMEYSRYELIIDDARDSQNQCLKILLSVLKEWRLFEAPHLYRFRESVAIA